MFNNSNGVPFMMNVEPAGTGNGFGDQNGGWLWLLILIILFAGNGWGNYGGSGVFGGANGVNDGYILTSDFAKVESKLDGVNNGICSLGYDQLSQMNGINQNVSTQGAAIQNAITQQTIADMNNVNAINAQITGLGNQLASCCCDQKYQMAQSFADLNYRLAEQSCQTRQTVVDSTATIVANQDANTRAILDYLTQDKISTLQAENQTLKFAASQAAQNAYIVESQAAQTAQILDTLNPCPKPAYVVTAPTPVVYNTGCNCGGCNTYGTIA